MNTNEFKFAVTVHEPGEKVEDILKNIDLDKSEDGSLTFVFNKEDVDTYEQAEDLVDDPSAFNAHITLGIVNLRDDMVYPSVVMTKRLADQTEEKEDEITLDNLSSIEPNEFEDLYQNEIERISHDYYGAPSKSKKEEKSSEEPHPSEDDQNNEEKDAAIPDKDDTSVSNKSESSMIPQNDQVEKLFDQVEEDPLLLLAIERYKNECKSELPVFSDVVMKQLQASYVNSEAVMNMAQNNAIYAIYDLFKEKLPSLERAFDEKYQESKDKHQKTIDTLKNNEKIEIDNITEKLTNNYQSARSEYVDGQKNTLEAHYDKENKPILDANLKHEQEAIRDKYSHLIEEENDRYNQAYDEAEDKFLNDQMRKIPINAIIKEVSNENDHQVNLLKEDATQFQDQVAVAAKEAFAERDKWKAKCQEATASMKNMEKTFDERVAIGIKEGVAERTQSFKDKENQMNERDSKRIEEMHQQSVQHAEEVKKNARDYAKDLEKVRADGEKDKKKALKENNENWQKKYDALKQENNDQVNDKDREIKNLEKERQGNLEEIEALKSLNNSLQASLDKFKGGNSSSINSVEQPSYRKNNVISKILITALSISTITFGGIFVYNQGRGQANDVQNTAVSQTSTTSSSQEYKKGDQRIYHDPDGKSYVVTMDSPSSGHYTDDKGVQHTLTYQN